MTAPPADLLERVVSALRACGASTAAARAAYRHGRRLARLTRRPRGIEYGTTLDGTSGAPLGPDLVGTWSPQSGNEINFGPHLDRLREGHRYIQIHSHPESTAPSDQDIALLVAYPALWILVVAGVNGTWYLLGKVPGADAPTGTQEAGRAARGRYQRIYEAFIPEVRALAVAGDLIEREARQIATHRTCEAIAPELGLQYHRLP